MAATFPTVAETPTFDVTLLFCDIAGFTRFTDRLGDVASYRIVKRCEALVVSEARDLHGELLEVRGDGFLLAFQSPLDAADCAVSIQHDVAVASDLPIHLRIGLHTGPAIHDGERYFGRTVIAAFRVSSLARADEILVSDETRRSLPSAMFTFGRSRDVHLKGFGQLQRVWGMNWRAARHADRSLLGTSGPPLRATHNGTPARAPVELHG